MLWLGAWAPLPLAGDGWSTDAIGTTTGGKSQKPDGTGSQNALTSFIAFNTVNGGGNLLPHGAHDHRVGKSEHTLFHDKLKGKFPFNGHIAMILVYNRILTGTERFNIQSYLTVFYGF